MSTSNKERQRRWKEKQKDKRQVTVMLPKDVYVSLKKIKEQTGDNFSLIMDNAIQNYSRTLVSGISKHYENADTLNKQHADLEEYMQKFNKELISTNKRLQKETESRSKAERSLKENEERLRFIFENSYDVIFLANLERRDFSYISPSVKRVLGYTPEEMKNFGFNKLMALIHLEDQPRARRHFNLYKVSSHEEVDSSIELRMKHKTLSYRWTMTSYNVMFNKKNKAVFAIGNVIDIHKGKQAEIALHKLYEELEVKVKERTLTLEEYNSALKLMLRKEDEVRLELEDKILSNVKGLVQPYVEKLKISQLGEKQRTYVDIMESNLNDIISPFVHSLNSRFLGLSPGEIEVASLIRHGKTTKEIAELLNLSDRTIEFHRANIRKKLGIQNKKVSLRSRLLSIK